MTANHLRKLFPNQEVFNSLDRNSAGVTVSEADEKDTKSGDEDILPHTEPTTPSTDSFAPSSLEPPPSIDLGDPEDDSITPCGIAGTIRNPFSEPPSPGGESDSTISAVPRGSPGPSSHHANDDTPGEQAESRPVKFVSRLPRRSKPAARYVLFTRSYHTFLTVTALPTLSSVFRMAIHHRDATSMKRCRSFGPIRRAPYIDRTRNAAK